ncbi:conserved hypothetical protein [Burkholderia pseudomallei Pakistan 9]|nr:conserved hypothetical protein [Burkholderia pseudomallei Pakistan 9]
MAGAREAALTRGAGATFAAGLPWLAAPGGAVHPALADAEPAERFDPVLGGTGFAPPFDSARGMAAEGCHPLGAAAGIRPFDSAGPGSITIRPVRGSVAARTSPDSPADSAPEAAPARTLHAGAACSAGWRVPSARACRTVGAARARRARAVRAARARRIRIRERGLGRFAAAWNHDHPAVARLLRERRAHPARQRERHGKARARCAACVSRHRALLEARLETQLETV